MKNITHKLTGKEKRRFDKRALRKQENHNELKRYCKIMDYCLEVGFFYHEAKPYVRSLLGKW